MEIKDVNLMDAPTITVQVIIYPKNMEIKSIVGAEKTFEIAAVQTTEKNIAYLEFYIPGSDVNFFKSPRVHEDGIDYGDDSNSEEIDVTHQVTSYISAKLKVNGNSSIGMAESTLCLYNLSQCEGVVSMNNY